MAPPDAVTIRAAARRLGVHENTIRNWMHNGIIQFYRLPSGIRRIPLAEVHRLEGEMFSSARVIDYDRKPTSPPITLARVAITRS